MGMAKTFPSFTWGLRGAMVTYFFNFQKSILVTGEITTTQYNGSEKVNRPSD